MRALTLKQPWAGAVAHLGKDIENRSWPPPKDAMGTRIAIHAGGGRDGLAYAMLPPNVSVPPGVNDPRLAIVAVATVVGATHYDHGGNYGGRLTQNELRYLRINQRGWALPHCWNWLLRDIAALPEPVRCKGRLGLWNLAEDIERAVLAQVEA